MRGKGTKNITLDVEEYASAVVESFEGISPYVVIHRLAGVTSREFLVALPWSCQGFAARNEIEKRLEEKNTRQGVRSSPRDKERTPV